MIRLNQYKLAFLIHGEQKDYDEVGLLASKILEQHTDFGNPMIEACRFNIALEKGESPQKGAERRFRHLLKKTTSIYYVNLDVTKFKLKIIDSYLSDVWNYLLQYEGNDEILKAKGIYKRLPCQIYKHKNKKDKLYVEK